MKHEEPISASLYSCAANAIRSLSEHYEAMLSAGVKPEDVLSRLVLHLDKINQSTADEASKTKAKNELLAFATKNLMGTDGWPVVSGLFDDGWTPPNFVRESVDESATPSTHVLFHLNRFHGVVNGKSVKPMTEPELHRHLVRDHGYDKRKAMDMIQHFKSGNSTGETFHNSTGMVDSALRHTQAALASHLAGNHAMKDNHLKCASAHMDRALDSLNRNDPGTVHHLPGKLRTFQKTLGAFK